jgi:uncharacterized hydrophobic protein (TIGR00271 family)
MSDSFLLFDNVTKDEISEEVLPLFTEKVLPKEWDVVSPAKFSEGSRVYAYISDEHAPGVIEAAIEGNWWLSILPNVHSPYANSGFCIESNLEHIIEVAETASPQKVDILRCNNQLILSSTVIGYSFNLLPTAKHLQWLERVKLAIFNILNIRSIRPQKMTFTTNENKNFSTAAIGLIIIKHSHGSSLSRNILSNTHLNDGMCHSMILAPRSVMQTLRFFVMSSFQDSINLPEFLGILKTKAYIVENDNPLDYKIDGIEYQAKKLEVTTDFQVLHLLIGDSLVEKEEPTSGNEECKVENIPAGGAIEAMMRKPLPFIARAARDEFVDLYQLLRDNAKASAAFLTLMVLSTLLASVGLFASSAPVIIGAMILAPLMAPIISLAMALVRQDLSLLTNSVKTLLIGSFLSLSFAAGASFIMPMETITPEIAARLSPSLLDLAVAVISGIAGAYAHARIEAAKSMAGVAIAVALVPPLAVTGIGLGWFDLHVAWGALLLFLTNLFGIVFAASLTFLALGFAPFTRAKKGLTIAFMAVALVSIPLIFSFLRLSDESSIMQQLNGKRIGEISIQQVHARSLQPLELSLQLVSPSALSNETLDNIKSEIEIQLKRDIVMEAQVIIRR